MDAIQKEIDSNTNQINEVNNQIEKEKKENSLLIEMNNHYEETVKQNALLTRELFHLTIQQHELEIKAEVQKRYMISLIFLLCCQCIGIFLNVIVGTFLLLLRMCCLGCVCGCAKGLCRLGLNNSESILSCGLILLLYSCCTGSFCEWTKDIARSFSRNNR